MLCFKNLMLLVLLTVIICISGCSSAPSKDIIAESLFAKNPLTQSRYSSGDIKIKDLDITNSYTKEINGEKVYFYEVDVKFQVDGEDYSAKDMTKITKRGNRWYFLN